VNGHLAVALPFWLDRPDDEALDVALAARDADFDTLWIGEMATYDAFALAARTTHARNHRVPAVDPGRDTGRLHRAARSQPRLDCETRYRPDDDPPLDSDFISLLD
jgi:hypothetical protein